MELGLGVVGVGFGCRPCAVQLVLGMGFPGRLWGHVWHCYGMWTSGVDVMLGGGVGVSRGLVVVGGIVWSSLVQMSMLGWVVLG